jgi:rhodanese-related sulfurtransferase
MKINKKNISILIIIVGLILALIISTLNNEKKIESEDEKIASFYAHEVATKISPHGLRKKMAEGDTSFILVDVRSEEEYIDEHIIGAVNIPAYIDKENSKHTDKERIVLDFTKLEKENPYKDIIIYCYSYACMTGKKIGHLLATNNIFVQELGVG